MVFDPSQVTVDQMIDAVNRLGFKAFLKRTSRGLPTG